VRTWGPHMPTSSPRNLEQQVASNSDGSTEQQPLSHARYLSRPDGRLLATEQNRFRPLAMDYYYPMEMEEHPGFFRPAQLPWQWQWQWRLFSLLSSQPPELLPPRRPPANHVRWEETAAAHLFSASLPGNPHSIPDRLARAARRRRSVQPPASQLS
jgi:HSP20 family protein